MSEHCEICNGLVSDHVDGIKCCSHCGQQESYSGPADATSFHVECLNCHAKSARFSPPNYDEEAKGWDYWAAESIRKSIEHWNTRASHYE